MRQPSNSNFPGNMRRSPGGRGGPPRPRHGHGHAPPHGAYGAAPPPPHFAPPGVPPHQGRGFGQHHPPPPPPPPPMPMAPSPRPNSATLERDVVAFVNSMRASRSDVKTPPNALNMRELLQTICAQFGVSTYEELFGSQPWQLPVLRQVQIQHERVWSFVTCYMHARRINTLYECHAAFLESEGIQHFSELGIGNSFLLTDAVQSLYHAPATIYRLSTHDVLKAFRQFETMLGHDAFASTPQQKYQQPRPPQRIDRDQFKQFIAQQCRQPSAEAMGLHIDADAFGPYIAMLRRISKKEQREIHELQDEFNKGIADRVFELSKEKFSAENRQLALADLMQRTNEERAVEMARSGGGDSGHRGGKKAATTLSSLSLEILNRVTDVDVYLDNVLRRKSADERFKPRLQAHAIADTDQKIRTQLTQFLLASQKSRHHARVKVVTWVLCGILAKIHSLLQLDDKLPEAGLSKELTDAGAAKKQSKGDDKEDDEEECDCCCVGEDTCRCRCQCECHQDESDNEAEAPKPAEEAVSSQPSSPVKRKRSRSRSNSVVAMPSSEDILSALEGFLAEEFGSADSPIESSEAAVRLLARADDHLRTKFGGNVLGSFSVVQELAKSIDAETDADTARANERGMQQAVECIRRGDAARGHYSSTSALSEDEAREFVGACVTAVQTQWADTDTKSVVRQAILRHACVQFCVDASNTRTRDWLGCLIEEVSSNVSESGGLQRTSEGSVVHFAEALKVPTTINSMLEQDAPTSNELALLEDSAAREQVIETKTKDALATLARCPFLVDVAEWTQWRASFEPFCGSLLPFLRSHEMICGSRRDDRVGNQSEFVCCTNSQVVRIRSSDEASASALDAVGLAPEQVALEIVSLFVQHRGSLDDFPRALVLLHLRTRLKNVSSHDQISDNASDASDAAVGRFVLEVLLFVPLDFASFVLELLEEAALPVDVETMAVKCCRTRFERRRLQLVGGSVNSKNKWTEASDDVRDDQSATKPQPSAIRVLPTSIMSRIDGATARTNEEQDNVAASSDKAEAESSIEPKTPIVPLDSSACESFISTLRRDQFGIGLQIADAATRAVLQAQHRRLERALKRLSDELYSEKTHFVLELLQNADDNAYSAGVVPRGEFILTRSGEVVFINNETGFSQANIQAICDVGASTKEHDLEEHPDSKKHSIGKKGIGFKSVFKISNVPEVHSNGFHIQFRANQEEEHSRSGLGYILPHWIEDRSRWKLSDGTTFVLPMNEHSKQRQSEISSSLLAFEPSVLLFLQKIRELRLANQLTGGQMAFEKQEKTVAIVEETGFEDLPTTISVATLNAQHDHGEGVSVSSTQRWFVVRRQLAVPAAFANRGLYTEIAIAIPEQPVNDDGNDDDDEATSRRPPLQPVFCYLPLRSYGFRFIIQGDFEVPSSREAISNGSDWNQWLVAQYPALLPALINYMSREKLSLRHLLRVLPLDSDIQAPFRSIVGEISREIRQLPCFPSATRTDQLYSASELLDMSEFVGGGDDDDVAFLLDDYDDSILHRALNKRVLDVGLARTIPPLLKAQLRIERLRASHVLRLLSHVCASSTHFQDTLVVLKLLKLLVTLWRHDRHRALLLQELRRIKCFPVAKSGQVQWTSLAEVKGALFIRSLHGSSGKSKSAAGAMNDLLRDDALSLLRDDFTTLLEDKFTETRRFLIEQLGVKELEDHDLITHHILPAMATTSISQESKWREHVHFLASHVASGCTNGSSTCPLRSAIQKAMRVKTCKGHVSGIHADNETVFVVLPAVSKLLSTCSKWLRSHVSNAATGFDVVDLESFGPELDSDAHRALWIDTCDIPQLFDAGSTRSHAALAQVVQWIQVEKDVSQKRIIAGELARFLDTTWPSKPVTALSPTTKTWWEQARWLEGSDAKFYRPSELWVTSAAVVSLFASSMVPITKIAFESAALRADWQLKASPTTSDVLQVLQRMSAEAVSSLTTVEQMTRLYTFLLEQSRQDSTPTAAAAIREAFTNKPLIFIPPTTPDEQSGTRFVGVGGAVWSSGGAVASLAAVALDAIYYKSLRAFFVGVCGVDRKPSMEHLQDALQAQLTKVSTLSKRDWATSVVPVLLLLAKALQKGKLSTAETKTLKKTLRSVAWIPVSSSSTEEGKASCLLASPKKSKLVFPGNDDDREIRRLWLSLASGHQKQHDAAQRVHFVAIDDDDVLMDMVPLLRMVGVASVSESLVSQPAEWCSWLGDLGASALQNDSDPKTRRRSQKKYEKLLKRVLSLWAAERAREDQTSWGSSEFATALSTHALFPSYQCPDLQRGVDLFLNDQSEWSQEQLTGGTLQTLSLFAWDFFVESDSGSDALGIQSLLCEVAQIRSLQANLHREVVVLGPQSDVVDEAFTSSLSRALGVAQRVVFAQHPASYARLDHSQLQQLLPHVKVVEVQGDERALQLLLRVATTDFTQRKTVSCYLDKPTKQLFIVQSAADESLPLFDALQEICRQSFGSKIATSVANVLYLASMQPTSEALESWLVDTQRVPPLDARAGQTLWIADSGDAVETKSRSKRAQATSESDVGDQLEGLEDGELEDEGEFNAAGKRAKFDHTWDPSQAPQRWAGPGSQHTSRSGANHGADGYFQSAYVSSAAYPPPPRSQHAPPVPNSYGASPLQSLSFAGAPGASTNTLSDEEKIAIGRWGEEYVYQQLKKSYAGRPEVHVDWVNGKEESGLPYDIVVKTGSSQDVEYVEVKSTKTMEKGVFEISMNELDQAAMHGSRYCIYRVFNAGNAALCRVVRMKNPISLVRQKKISLVLLMQ